MDCAINTPVDRFALTKTKKDGDYEQQKTYEGGLERP